MSAGNSEEEADGGASEEADDEATETTVAADAVTAVAAIVLDKARGRVLPPVEAAIPALGAVTTTLVVPIS